MPLLYRSEYIKTEIAPYPLLVPGSGVAELGQNFDRALNGLYESLRAHFLARNAAVYYDPIRQQIEVMFRVDDLEPGSYYQYQATVAALLNTANLAEPLVGGGVEVYPVITATVRRILQGYWVVFDNSDRLHEKLAEEIRGLLPQGQPQ